MRFCQGLFIQGLVLAGAEKCTLFDVECNIATKKFKVSTNKECRNAEYSHLPDDFAGVFAYAETTTDTIPAGLKDECKFDADGSTEFGFDSCGVSVHTAPSGDDLGYYTTYIHHLQEVGGIVTSQMDHNTATCYLSHANVDTLIGGEEPEIVKPNPDIPELSIIYSSDIVKNFNLRMVLGENDSDGKFQELTKDDRVRVGSPLIIKLDFSTTDLSYVFGYFNCFVSAQVEGVGEKMIELYDGFCPKEGITSTFNLHRKSTSSFGINAFRIMTSGSLTFSCEVAVYPNFQSMPQTCTDGVTNVDTGSVSNSVDTGRKRRSVDDQNSVNDRVSFTINISDDHEKLSSSAFSNSAAMFPILFSYLIFSV